MDRTEVSRRRARRWPGLTSLLPIILGLAACGLAERKPSLRYEISVSARELYEYIDDERVNTYPIAVGKPGHATPRGSFAIHRVDWNPDWTPPDSEWADGETYKAPGESGNPMGRARLVFKAPYTIHGTSDTGSLGRAASHGSVRIANDVVLRLARRIMEHGGAGRSESWYEDVIASPERMVQVNIPNPIPLRIRD